MPYSSRSEICLQKICKQLPNSTYGSGYHSKPEMILQNGILKEDLFKILNLLSNSIKIFNYLVAESYNFMMLNKWLDLWQQYLYLFIVDDFEYSKFRENLTKTKAKEMLPYAKQITENK